MQLDIIRTSASRPDLLKVSTQSILNNLKFSGQINWFLHEDVLNEAASNECIRYSESLGIYKKISKNQPPLGHTKSFLELTKSITSPYFMYIEDDYELLQVYECQNSNCKKKTGNKYKDANIETCKHCGTPFIESPTDLDVLINLMETHKNINEIVFPKRDIMPDKGDFVKKTVNVDGVFLTVCHHWYVSPAIWRTSFIMPIIEKMRKEYKAPPSGFGWHWEINRLLKGSNNITDAEWIQQHVGTYYLGEIRGGHRVYHLGTGDKSLKEKKYQW